MGIDVDLKDIAEFLSIVLGVKPLWNFAYREYGRRIATIWTSLDYILF